VKSPDGKDDTARTMLQELLHHWVAFKAEWRPVEREMPVLRFDLSRANGKLKKSTAATSGGMARHGEMKFTKTKAATIVRLLGNLGLGEAVVDETGLTGDYVIDLNWNVADKDAFLKAIQELGFVYSREKRTVKVLFVDPS
jgi:uncharacterized protein (TIGR03435 family)